MRLSRYLTPELIELNLDSLVDLDFPEDTSEQRRVRETKERVIGALSVVLNRSGSVRNAQRLFRDLHNREKKATTGIGRGVAIPHVRTLQVKDFVIAFARSDVGMEFEALDGRPVTIFFPMASPPDDDRFYLKVYRSLSEILRFEDSVRHLTEAEDPHQILRIIRSFE
ncbi:MAG: PTS sugar transporter subunit IIA [Candidatus Eisenbacteria bacterium]|nr:PTS sugar transporter subunit IIA [Candidatus Eisenbacteria bacterium]